MSEKLLPPESEAIVVDRAVRVASDQERLVRVETKVDLLTVDVGEIKADVRSLTRQADERRGRSDSRSDLGIWARAAVPWLVGGGALLLSIINAVRF